MGSLHYEISLWKNGSLILDGVSLVNTIRNWWDGNIALSKLFITLIDISLTLISRYFNAPKDHAVANAYNTLGLSRRTKNRNVVIKRYKELAAIYHPDKGGSLETMREINVSRDIILETLYPK